MARPNNTPLNVLTKTIQLQFKLLMNGYSDRKFARFQIIRLENYAFKDLTQIHVKKNSFTTFTEV